MLGPKEEEYAYACKRFMSRAIVFLFWACSGLPRLTLWECPNKGSEL